MSAASTSRSRNRTASASEAAAFDPWLLWIAFRRHWFWALPLGLLLAAGAGFFVYRGFVPEYQATHILEANRDYVVFQGVISAPDDLANVEKQILLNALVLDPVLADPEVCKSPSLRDPSERERNLRQRLTVGTAGTKQLLTVSYRETDPEYSALVCNAVVDSYLRQRESFDSKRMSDLEGWLKPAIDRWEAEVKSHQGRVRELSKQAKGFDPYNEVSRVEKGTATMSGLFAQLTKVKGDEEVLRARLDSEKARLEAVAESGEQSAFNVAPGPDQIEQFVASDSAVAQLRNRRAEKQSQMRRMEDNDLVRINRDWYNTLSRDVTSITRQLEKAEATAAEQAVAYLKERAIQQRAADRSAGLAAMQKELNDLESTRQTLQKSFDEEKVRLEQFAGESVDLYFAQQEYDQAAAILEKLNMRIASLRTERQRGATIQTLAKATPPASPIGEMPWKKIMMVVAGGCGFPFALALAWEFRVKRISTAEAIESHNWLSVIGEVARLPTSSSLGLKRRMFEESVDTLRANLLLSPDLMQARSFAVASSVSGEGKSSLVSQLAVSIAKATGETVLLVDADIRSPDQHHMFGIEMGPGLVKVLTGRARLNDAIDRSLGGLVHVLPAGYLDSNPHRILTPSSIRKLIDDAHDQLGYRYVLFDTAPVLSAGETLSVAGEVDASLLCVMRDHSRVSTVERTVKRLESTGAALAGMVFNGVPSRQYAYRYGDYRYGDAERRIAHDAAMADSLP